MLLVMSKEVKLSSVQPVDMYIVLTKVKNMVWLGMRKVESLLKSVPPVLDSHLTVARERMDGFYLLDWLDIIVDSLPISDLLL